MALHPSQVIARPMPHDAAYAPSPTWSGPGAAAVRQDQEIARTREAAERARRTTRESGADRATRVQTGRVQTGRVRTGRVQRSRPETTSRGTNYRPDIDGLRAVAVLAVVLFHAGVPFLTGGYVGVDVFYVLSGFLITGLLVGELQRTGTVSLVSFYARRIRRLLPASVLVLTVTAALSAVLLPPLSRADVSGDVVSAALYVSNWHFAAQATDYLSADMTPSPVLHFWSLGVEEQFYLVWPALLLLAWRGTVSRGGHVRRPRLLAGVVVAIVVAVILSFILSLKLTASAQPWAFFGSPTRGWELGAGALVAILGSSPSLLRFPIRAWLGWIGLGLILFACVRLNGETAYPGTAALLPVLGACALLLGGAPSWRRTEQVDATQDLPGPASLLAHKSLRFIGTVSYSWYLWHWPLLVLPAAYLAPEPMTSAQKALAVVASFGLAVATYYLIENPVRFMPVLVRRPRLALSFGAVLTVSAVLAGVALGINAKSANDVEQAESQAPISAGGAVGGAADGAATAAVPVRGVTPSPAAARDDLPVIYADGCNLEYTGVVSPPCVYGDPNGTKRVVLFGDSHAAQWFPAVNQVAQNRKWTLVSLTKAGCPASEVTVLFRNDGTPYKDCDTWRAGAINRIVKNEHPDLIVISQRVDYEVLSSSGGRLSTTAAIPDVASGLRKTVKRFAALGIPVVVIRDNPRAALDVPVCVSRDTLNTARCEFDREKSLPSDQALLAKVVGIKGVHVVDLDSTICPPKPRCPVVSNGILMYRDDDHMTATYSTSLAPRLDAAIPQI